MEGDVCQGADPKGRMKKEASCRVCVVVHTRDPAHGRLRRGLTGPGQPGTYETMSRKAAEDTGSNPAYAVQQLRRCLNKELSEGLGSSPQSHTHRYIGVGGHRQNGGTCVILVTALNT